MNKLLAQAAHLKNAIFDTGMRRASIYITSVLFLYPASASAIQCASPPTALDYAFCQDAGLRGMVEEGAQIIQNIWSLLNPEQQQRLGPDQAAWRKRTMTACGLRAWSGIIAPEITACLRREVFARNQVLRNLVAEAPVAPPAQLSPGTIVPPRADTAGQPTPLYTPMPPAAPQRFAALAADHGAIYQKGLSDRADWEMWFNSLQGDYKSGAFYWSSQRSLPHPGSCQQMNAEFAAGCTAAQIRLDPSDTLRRSQPDYKLGWNAWASPAQNALQPPSATEQKIVCRDRYNPSPVTAEERRTGAGHVYYGCEPSAAPTASSAPPPAAEPTVPVPAPTAAQEAAAAQPAPPPVPTLSPMPATTARESKLPEPSMSDAQIEAAFVEIVGNARERYQAGANDLARGASRPWRREHICALLPGLGVNAWHGIIEKLTSSSAGMGVLSVRIGTHIHVKTTNNNLSDLMDHTLIEPASAVFQQLLEMQAGDDIVFSGSFLPSQDDCALELSLTQQGSMTDSEFLFRFASVRRAPRS
jgi:hypothetical protein